MLPRRLADFQDSLVRPMPPTRRPLTLVDLLPWAIPLALWVYVIWSVR